MKKHTTDFNLDRKFSPCKGKKKKKEFHFLLKSISVLL